MKYLFLLFVLISFLPTFGQSLKIDASSIGNQNFDPIYTQSKISLDAVTVLNKSKLVTVNTQNTYFQKSFLVSDNGDAITDSYMPSPYFRPNDNLVIVTGQSPRSRDSFNPYGATDLTSIVFLSTVNSFISKIRIGKR